MAEETGETLKSEVKIAEITRIEIITKTRTIDLEEAQAVEVIGYDREGNAFSTLEGIRFKWSLVKCDNILEIIPIKVILVSSIK